MTEGIVGKRQEQSLARSTILVVHPPDCYSLIDSSLLLFNHGGDRNKHWMTSSVDSGSPSDLVFGALLHFSRWGLVFFSSQLNRMNDGNVSRASEKDGLHGRKRKFYFSYSPSLEHRRKRETVVCSHLISALLFLRKTKAFLSGCSMDVIWWESKARRKEKKKCEYLT